MWEEEELFRYTPRVFKYFFLSRALQLNWHLLIYKILRGLERNKSSCKISGLLSQKKKKINKSIHLPQIMLKSETHYRS